MGQANFYTHSPSGLGVGTYQFSGVDINDPRLNDEFNDYINGTYLYSYRYAEKLRTVLSSAALQGSAFNYGFLGEMPEDEALEWLDKAILQLKRAYKKDPENNQPIGIVPTLDRLRAQRKANRKPKKSKKEES